MSDEKVKSKKLTWEQRSRIAVGYSISNGPMRVVTLAEEKQETGDSGRGNVGPTTKSGGD